MMNSKLRGPFQELATGVIGTNKYLVVSGRDDGRYSIAQQVEAETDDGPIRIFLKNAIVVDRDGLGAVHQILAEALDNLRE